MSRLKLIVEFSCVPSRNFHQVYFSFSSILDRHLPSQVGMVIAFPALGQIKMKLEQTLKLHYVLRTVACTLMWAHARNIMNSSTHRASYKYADCRCRCLHDKRSTTDYTYQFSRYLVVPRMLVTKLFFNPINRCTLRAPNHKEVRFFNLRTDLKLSI